MSGQKFYQFFGESLYDLFTCNTKDPNSDYYFYGAQFEVVVPIYFDNFEGQRLFVELFYTVDWFIAINEYISDYSDGIIKSIDLKKINHEYFKRKKLEKRKEIDLYIETYFKNFKVYNYGKLLFEERDKGFNGTEVQNNLKQKVAKQFIKANKISNSNKDIIAVLDQHIEELYDPHEQYPRKFFSSMKTLIEKNADEILFSDKEYEKMQNKLNNFSFATLMGNKINIVDVNEIEEILKKQKNSPLKQIVHSIYSSVLGYATDTNKIGICKKCKHYFIAKKGKKYCSTASEGLDCGKSARNQKAYIKRKHPLLKNQKPV